MSILPTQAQGFASSSSFDSSHTTPNSSNHGNRHLSPHPSPSSLSRQFQSLPFPDPSSPIAPLSGPAAPVAEDSGGSSQQVINVGTPNAKSAFSHENGEEHSQTHLGGRSKSKMPGRVGTSQGQQSNGSGNSNGGHSQSSGRRAQMMNANHLLNFHYDPIARPQLRLPPPRRSQKIKPYNRDLFLQANYKFVVLDTGKYAFETMDPDKMFRWEDIICVRHSTAFPVQCPICLESPLCPQITSCGHIFCFPCILQYLLMGKEDLKGDCFKRCPLCFVMVSQKDLYTVFIEEVKQYSVGDVVEFLLLNREKDSVTPSQKNKQEADVIPTHSADIYDPFSKVTFTSDVELSVRKAISDLDSWLARADSGLVDDLEKLPYVCAAMEQLRLRKKHWNEQRAWSNERSNKYANSQKESQVLLSTGYISTEKATCNFENSSPPDYSCDQNKANDVMLGMDKSLEGQEVLSSSYDESKGLQTPSNSSTDVKDKDSYNFYQAVDGQHLILHPLNMKCLLHHYGSIDMLPCRISGRILQFETVTQSEAMRRRYRFLSHFSLTTTFQLCEIDLGELLPHSAFIPFMDEIKKREKHRKQLANKERKEKIKAEVAAAASAAVHTIPSFSSSGQSSQDDSPIFSMDDFAALGGSNAMSSSPPIVGERILFSNVARLGFAAGHDSPGLKIEETGAPHNNNMKNDSAVVTGSGNSGPPSFADIMSRAKSVQNLEASKMNEVGKKGKKASRVLLSTAGGRRY